MIKKQSLLLFLMCFIFSASISYSQDLDNDTVLDNADLDDDNDGILDNDEGAICFTTPRLIDNSVATASAFGSGQSGVPNLSYDVPDGVNRMMLVIITVERDHTIAPYGDNWESNWPISQNPLDRQLISYGGIPMILDRLRFTYNYYEASVDPVENIPANAEHSSTTYIYKMFEGTIPEGFNAFDFSEFILPTNSGDEFSVIVSTYEGVADFQEIAINSFPRTTNFTWDLSGDALSPTQNDGTTEDQNLLLAYGSIGTENGFTASANWDSIVSTTVDNNAGTYISDITPGEYQGTENDGISGGLYSLSGVTGNQSITFTTNYSTTGVLHKHIILYRLIGFAITDTDNDGLANCADIDSDNDGIPDNVEAQPTVSYIPPSTTIDAVTGINTAYPLGITTFEDSDGDGTPDYLDSDSDGDTILDIQENGDVNTLSGGDLDQDGLDNNFDSNNANFDTNDEVTSGTITELATIFGDLDADLPIGGDLDYRDVFNVNPPVSAMIDFDGIDDYIEVPESVINDLDEFTISFWIKPETLPTGGVFDREFVIGQKERFEISLGNDEQGSPNIWSHYFYGIGPSSASIGASINNQEWMHYAVVVNFNTNIILAYKNGEPITPLGASNTPLTNSNPLRMGSIADTQPAITENFDGWLDEVRIFNGTLSSSQIQRMVFQEIEQNGSNIRGSLIEKDITDESTNIPIPWSNLISYYPMTNITTGRLLDFSSNNKDAFLYNITTALPQSAPMPFETVNDGPWSSESTWLHGDVWDIEDAINNKEWNIVNIKNNVTLSTSHSQLGLLIDEDDTLSVLGENQINNTWYLKLDGTIDLQSDSQLIQSVNSDLVTSATGNIMRRQEGNTNVYSYNYWSSPVGVQGVTTISDNNAASNNPNNSIFNLTMLKNEAGEALQFTSAQDQQGMISQSWLFSYLNGQTFWDWTALTPTSNILPGTGYTQKGTGNEGEEQQYIFQGKPNNGTILITADDVSDASEVGIGESVQDVTLTTSFVGNPYPSALDARQFIADNQDVIGGAIYVWEQWAGTSHVLEEYQGGYGTINNVTTERAYLWDDPTQTASSLARKPTFYIPVAQGFFVEVINDGDIAILSNTDDIEFNNGQRVFIKESDADDTDPNNGSVFFRNSNNSEEDENDLAMIRFELSVSNGNNRSFVLAFSDQTTDAFDYGYDARTIDPQDDDMSSFIGSEKMLIQSLSPITDDKIVDLVFNSTGIYNYTLEIVEMTNIPEDRDVFIKDNLTNTVFNLRDGAYNFTSNVSTEDYDRFDIVFKNEALSNDDFLISDAIVYVNNNEGNLYIKTLNKEVKSLSLTNMLGQVVKTFSTFDQNSLENGLYIGELNTGVYLVNLVTDDNLKLDKKIILE